MNEWNRRYLRYYVVIRYSNVVFFLWNSCSKLYNNTVWAYCQAIVHDLLSSLLHDIWLIREKADSCIERWSEWLDECVCDVTLKDEFCRLQCGLSQTRSATRQHEHSHRHTDRWAWNVLPTVTSVHRWPGKTVENSLANTSWLIAQLSQGPRCYFYGQKV